MKISLSSYIDNKEGLEMMLCTLRFSKTLDNEIILNSIDPFDYKVQYDNGFERIVPLADIESDNNNILNLGDTVKIYLSNGWKTFTMSKGNSLDSIYVLANHNDRYNIEVIKNTNVIATIRVDYDDPLNSYIELY